RSYPKAPFSGLEKSEADRLEASLFDLAPDGVCLAVTLAWNAVGSYPTISPLPLGPLGASRRFVFCGTFLHPVSYLAVLNGATGRYPASCPLEFGLSSTGP